MNQNTINPLYILKQEFQRETEFFKYDIKYPILLPILNYYCTSYYNLNVINNINNTIYLDIKNLKDKVKSESKEYKKEYYQIVLSESNKDYVKYQYELYIDYKLTYNKNNVISIPMNVYEFTGGAHGMTYLNSYNYNLINGKKLKLSDIFKENIDYKNIIDNYIKYVIKKNPDIYFQGNNGFKGIKEEQSFYIEDDGIVIYFDLYEIAPYYVGIPNFKIKYDEFIKYFKSI